MSPVVPYLDLVAALATWLLLVRVVYLIHMARRARPRSGRSARAGRELRKMDRTQDKPGRDSLYL